MSSEDKDLLLKQRIMRILWRWGYFVRQNIKLTREIEGGRSDITDIDVLGIKISNNLSTNYIICDCKSGRVSNANRLLWISGVTNYFGASTAYFIRDSMIASEYMTLMEKLGIKCITKAHLSMLEKIYNINESDYYGPFCLEQKATERIFNSLNRIEREMVYYVLVKYWEDPPQQQILTLINICRDLNKARMEPFIKKFFMSYNMAMLSMSSIKFAHLILLLPQGQQDNIVTELLLGGDIPFIRRRSLLEKFYNFMVSEIRERYKEKYPVTREEFISGMFPEYQKYLVDFIVRLCKYPESAPILPRFFDLITYESIQNQRPIHYEKILLGITHENLSLKPIKDFIVFATRSGILNEELQNFFHSKVEEFEKSIGI